MSDEERLAAVLRALPWRVDAVGAELSGSASGSAVYPVQIDGIDAVLKVTMAGPAQVNEPFRVTVGDVR